MLAIAAKRCGGAFQMAECPRGAASRVPVLPRPGSQNIW
jgi:hypothetical protein